MTDPTNGLALTQARAYVDGRIGGATNDVVQQRQARQQNANAQRQAKRQWHDQQVDAAVAQAKADKADADGRLADAQADEADVAQQQGAYRDQVAQQHLLILSHAGRIKLETANVDTLNYGMPAYICHGVPEEAAWLVINAVCARMFYLAYIDAHNKHGAPFFNMVFLRKPPINYQLGFPFDAAALDTFVDENAVYHNGLLNLTSYLTMKEELRYAARWTLWTKEDWQHYREVPFDQVPARIAALAAQGYALLDQSYVQKSDGQILGCGLVMKLPEPTVSVQLVPADQYQSKLAELAAQGMLPTHLDVTEINGEPRFSAVWQRAAFEAYEGHHHMEGKDLNAQHEQLMAQGLLPRVLVGYSNGDKAHYAAVWVREKAEATQDDGRHLPRRHES